MLKNYTVLNISVLNKEGISFLMRKLDFYYDLPEELIAQTPLEPRDSSRLMKIDKQTGEILHDHFYNITDYLREGDLLIMNNSKVFPARIYGIKRETGAVVQFLLLEQKSKTQWEVMVKPGKRLPVGTEVYFSDELSAKIVDVVDGGNRIAEFTFKDNIFSILDKIGQMPLPPYITEKLKNQQRYNTIYCKEIGSAAAPTAGLHFTGNVLDSLKQKGVDTAFVTLHVGLGTFRPVKVDDISQHKMHSEHYSLPQETADKINACKKRGCRVIAVGTTSCRTLESIALRGEIYACSGSTDIFISPGSKFLCIDGLITNFHLPESTLIMLVSAFLGYENTMNAYKTAIDEKYRFFSFGDSMIII